MRKRYRDRYYEINQLHPPVCTRCPDPAAKQEIQEAAASQGVSVSRWIWEAIQEHLARTKV